MIKLIERATLFNNRTAIICKGKSYTYGQLLEASKNVAFALLNGKKDLNGARIAYLVPSGFEYVCIQWGIWRAGGIAVPLCEKHPLSSIEYVLNDTQASVTIYAQEFESFLTPLFSIFEMRSMPLEHLEDRNGNLPSIDLARSAMILYTSGTTGSPKGVVTTHHNIQNQITSLTNSWAWNENDHILNVLPMHHLHGILNITSCALWVGACCEFLPKFSAEAVFSIFSKKQVNVFMAVPTIYFKLIAYWKGLSEVEQVSISNHLKKFRLMVSGSAALPVSVLEEWEHISGHTLLERYGMTEIGMAISNPYTGERKPGHIGQALQGVDVRLRNENNEPVKEGVAGEIQVKGPNVFKEYWKRPEETNAAFTADGWFKTGDIALYKDGSYKILGRNSIDIIKSGGYKISALEIEEVLRTHPKIKDCGVVGIPDLEWGEVIGASLILESKTLDLDQLKEWLKDKLPVYKVPRTYIFQEDLPRNVMGKVTKQQLKVLFASE